MGKYNEFARIVGYDSTSAFITTLRCRASDPKCDDRRMFLDAASVVDFLVTEVDCLTAEVERLTDKIDDLRDEIRNRQEM